jgi:hypothetical protein
VQINFFHPTLHSLSVLLLLSRRACNSAHIHTIHSFLQQLPLDRRLSTPPRSEHDLVRRQTTRPRRSDAQPRGGPTTPTRPRSPTCPLSVSLLPTIPAFPSPQFSVRLSGSLTATPPRSGFASPNKRQPMMSPSHGGGKLLLYGSRQAQNLSQLYQSLY